jgi:hypothetical protein
MKNLIRSFVSAVMVMLLNACTNELPPSTAISNYRSYPLINSTYITVADLASKNNDDQNHQITITKAGRIMVSAQVRIDNAGGIAVRGASQLLISDGTGPNNGLTEMGRSAVYFSDNNPASQLIVPVQGFAIKQPGTYNVIVKCEQLGVVGRTAGMLDNMLVWEGKE